MPLYACPPAPHSINSRSLKPITDVNIRGPMPEICLCCAGSGLDMVEYDLLEIGDDVVFGSRSAVGSLPAATIFSPHLQFLLLQYCTIPWQKKLRASTENLQVKAPKNLFSSDSPTKSKTQSTKRTVLKILTVPCHNTHNVMPKPLCTGALLFHCTTHCSVLLYWQPWHSALLWLPLWQMKTRQDKMYNESNFLRKQPALLAHTSDPLALNREEGSLRLRNSKHCRNLNSQNGGTPSLLSF